MTEKSNVQKNSTIKTKPFRLPAFFATLALLSACGDNAKLEQDVAAIQAVKLVKVTNLPETNKRSFPAEVSAVKTIDVSFEVAGRLSEVNLRTASQIQKGEMLAQLDPAPFERRVKEAKTRLLQAKRDLDRVISTHEKGLASQSQLDNAKTAFELAEIALNKAEQDLGYTKLTAPFDAQVSERFVENNSYVRAGDTIAKLQDMSRLFFNINVPERLLSGYQQGSLVKASAYSVTNPDKQYNLEYVEHSTLPDPITQTYKVVFAAQSRPQQNLTPGTRAVVDIVTSGQQASNALIVPFSAIKTANGQDFNLWLFDPKTSSVTNKKVHVLKVEQGYAAITGDIALGDLVVAAGASKMQEGLVVKPYVSER